MPKCSAALRDIEVETLPGVILGHKNIPVASVGCYVPGGRYPMVASAHMSIVTARVAGVKRIIACTPPLDGAPHAATIAAMALAGADEIYLLAASRRSPHGARHGDNSAVDMLVGPGNAYVAEAKRQLFGTVAIDLLAGPTETLVIADDTATQRVRDRPAWAGRARTEFASHLLITIQRLAGLIADVSSDSSKPLPTSEVAGQAWRDHGQIILFDKPRDARRGQPGRGRARRDSDAPAALVPRQHAQLRRPVPRTADQRGHGDKVIGTNHTLPTRGAARYTGGLWVGNS